MKLLDPSRFFMDNKKVVCAFRADRSRDHAHAEHRMSLWRQPNEGTGVGDEERDMASKLSKNIAKARALVEQRPYAISDAVPLLQKAKYAKFDETVDLTLRLGVDTQARRPDGPRHGGSAPRPGGKSKIVAVIASGDKVAEAEAAGAEFVGGEDLVEKIQKENWTAFDALIATPGHDAVRSAVWARCSAPAA